MRRGGATEPRHADGRLVLLRWIWIAQWRAQPGRALIAVVAIAIGVALALAIHLVNRSALVEFDSAIRITEGRAQAQIRPRSASFDEGLYARLAEDAPGVTASPVVEATFAVASRPGVALRVLGIDVFRAARVTPALLPAADRNEDGSPPIFDGDAIFLSPAALAELSANEGDTVRLLAGREAVALRIAGTVPGAQSGQVLGVMDIGTLQWRLGWLGRLTRIDLGFVPGTDVAAVRARWEPALGGEAVWTTPDAQRERASSLSRAYRVNLNMLAMIALFTGAFIVHATVALAVARQHRELALLSVLGAGDRLLVAQVLGQGLLLGALGAALGVAGGIAMATLLLESVGGDLGGGYFAGSRPALVLEPRSLIGFAAAGVATGLAGSLGSALAVRRLPGARALRAGGVEEVLRARRSLAWPLAWLAAGAAMLAVPMRGEVPWTAYAAIATWLFGAIALIPRIVALVAALLVRLRQAAGTSALTWLAVHRLSGARRSASAAMSGIVASFALAAAMAIMVSSFRASVDHWLGVVLPADAYGRVVSGARDGAIDRALQARIASLPGVARAEFHRAIELNPAPDRPPVALLVRPIDEARPGDRLAVLGATQRAPPGTVGIYVSEAISDRFGMKPGERVRLALPLPGSDTEPTLFVAGVWRDYGRQHGAIAIDSSQWRALGGDESVSDVAIWFDRGTDLASGMATLREALADVAGFELRSTGELREQSLRIFDRSFAVTYALEAIAILVALFGVASTWTAEGLARRHEFGMLRHLGLRGGEIARLFAIEASLQIAIAIAWGAVLGTAIALVLVHRVNPQSFHWTMEFVMPAGLLAASAAALLALGVAAAVFAARRAAQAPALALAQDW